MTPEPNWKEIAYELATIIDDIDLQFQMEHYSLPEGRNTPMYQESPKQKFLIKKFIAAQKHFIRYKNQILHIDEYKKQKDNEMQMMAALRNP